MTFHNHIRQYKKYWIKKTALQCTTVPVLTAATQAYAQFPNKTHAHACTHSQLFQTLAAMKVQKVLGRTLVSELSKSNKKLVDCKISQNFHSFQMTMKPKTVIAKKGTKGDNYTSSLNTNIINIKWCKISTNKL